MKFISLLMILSLLFLVSCSGGSNNENTETISADIDDSTEKLEVEDINMENAETATDISNAPSEPVSQADTLPADVAPVNTMPKDQNISVSDMSDYVIQPGDTYMLIAFKLYGDYTKWRELEQMNSMNQSGLKVGTTIKYSVPAQKFSWQPTGNPHLIIRGETLGTISTKYYDNPGKWKHIWENNRPMIKNPNLIFAGFTIYYPDLSHLASL